MTLSGEEADAADTRLETLAGLPGWPWPRDQRELLRLQEGLGQLAVSQPPWSPGGIADLLVAAAFVTYPSGREGPGDAGDPAWVAAVLVRGDRLLVEHVEVGETGGPYVAGLLALRCGVLLERALRVLPQPDLLLLDATGRDHPRRAGLALHIGAALQVPSIGVTNRSLLATYQRLPDARGSTAALLLEEDVVGYAVRTRPGANPVLAHAAWRTSPQMARDVVAALARRSRTPEPLRYARTVARVTRARAEGRFSG
jgi:deoxyribonuclease V